MWYFSENDERQGPVGLEELQELVMQGRVTHGTLVWQKGMAEWQPIERTELQDFLEKYAPPPLPNASLHAKPDSISFQQASQQDDCLSDGYQQYQYELSPRQQVKQLQTWFKACWLSIAIGAPLTIILIGIGGLITGIVFGYMILFKCWKLIQDGRPRTTPGRAVGFMFIPFFGLYWQFIAFLGLAQDMNRYMRNRKIRSAFISEELALWYCISVCVASVLSLLPWLSIPIGIASFILWIFLLNALKNAGIAILRSKEAQDA